MVASSDVLVDPAITNSEVSSAIPSPEPQEPQDANATEEATSSSSETEAALFANSNSVVAYASSAAATASAASAAATPTARVQQYSPAAHAHLVLYLAALHGARITADNLSGSFAPPLNHEKLLDWWRLRLATSAVFLLFRFPASPSAAPSTKVAGPDLVGVIMLRSHPAETSPHVASVELLLVNLQYRQLGGERQLLQTVEQQAIREGRTLLTAEAESKSTTAAMYAALGFTEAGRIPGMVLRPATGEKRAQSIFYKDLLEAQQAQAQP